jgi:hypothetical protein
MAWPDYTYNIFENFEDATLESGLTLTDTSGAVTIPSSAQYYIDTHSMALNLSGLTVRANISYGNCGNTASFGFWYRSGSYGGWAGGPMIFNLKSNAYGNLIQMIDERSAGDNTRRIRCNNQSIEVSDYTWYWLTVKFDRNATGYFRVYDTSGNIVGSAQSFSCVDYAADEGFYLGSWGGSHSCVVYFDALVVDTTNANFPLLGWETESGGTLPDGLTLNTSTGEISGTPTTEGTTTFTIKVTDNNGNETTQELSITITASGEYIGILKYWNGSVWAKTKIKTYDGASFIDAVLKIYQDSTWKLIDTTGV